MISLLSRRQSFRLLALTCCAALAASTVLPGAIRAQEASGGNSNVVVIRDAEAETLLHTYADPDSEARHVYLRDAVNLRADLEGAQ